MTNKFAFYNDSNRLVSIHPATITHGCEVDMDGIQPGEVRVFTLPEGTYAWTKFWDYGEKFGLQILVSPISLSDDNFVNHEPISPLGKGETQSIIEHFKKRNPHNKEDK